MKLSLLAFFRNHHDDAVAVRDLLVRCLSIDRRVAIGAIVYLLIFLPLTARDTQNPQLLAAFANDEPWQVMALEAMTVRPYGNPANFFSERPAAPVKIPEHWGSLRYTPPIYSGLYFDIAFAVFGPLHALGVPTFPAAPIIMRLISCIAGLLCLIAIYRFTVDLTASRAAGFAASFLLLSDANFIFYVTNIKPDTLQLLLGVLALRVAVQHAKKGDLTSLVCIGVMAGLVQGAKSGGAWLIPMSLMALASGASRIAWVTKRQFMSGLVRRATLLAGIAVSVWLLTTPYMLFDDYYRQIMAASVGNLRDQAFGGVTIVDWGRAIIDGSGWVACICAVATVVGAGLGRFDGRAKLGIIFAAVLIASQIIWYGALVKLWVVPGYILLATALGGSLAVVSAWAVLGRIVPLSARWAREKSAMTFCLLLVLTVYRSYPLLSNAMQERLHESNTVFEVNRWALARSLEGSRIVHDDLAYFDPQKFPRAHMYGGILTWRRFHLIDADYLVLSSSLWGAPWIEEMIEAQRLDRNVDRDERTGQYSVRLYQDLLPAEQTGSTGTPWIDFVHVIRATNSFPACPPRDGNYSAIDAALDDVMTDKKSGSATFPAKGAKTWAGLLHKCELYHLAYLKRLWENVSGARHDLFGPTLKIYRIHPPGGPLGRPHAFASNALEGYSPRYAFDGTANSAWNADNIGTSPAGDYIGWDYGGGSLNSVRRAKLTWVASQVPNRIRFEYSDDGEIWYTAGGFEVAVPDSFRGFRHDEFALDDVGRHRYWRVIAIEVPQNGRFGVSEIEFIESAGMATN